MTRDSPNVIALPPLILVAALGLAVLLGYVVPLGLLPPALAMPATVAGGALIVLGGALGVSGILAFRAAGTHVEPFKPALALVESGPYRFTRNPMYLGLMLGHVAVSLIASLDWGLVTLIPLALTLHFGVVLREERYLAAKFGQPYTDYLARTRRWL